jgi:putative salt-induced outer membrane protein YdiY
MRNATRRVVPMILTVWFAGAGVTSAQPTPPAAPPPPPPPWTGNAGFGLSLSRGNTETANLNISFEATHDPKTVSVSKFKGLYLRGETNGAVSVDRLHLEARHERTLAPRVYAFGNLQFLKDQFKDIDYLIAPSGGIGYKLVATPVTTFNVDAGLGAKFEKNPGLDRRTNAVVTASDKFEHKLSPTATLTQSFGAIWKAKDFGDALYTLTAGIAAALTARTQLKVELLDSYATRPPSAAVQSNDVSLLTALVYKF